MDAAMELLVSKKQKLKRIRRQRCFLKEKEQRIFDSGLSNIEELERLKDLEKVQEIAQAILDTTSANQLPDFSAFSPSAFDWVGNFETEIPLASQDS